MERVPVPIALAVLGAPLALFRRKGRHDEVALEPAASPAAAGVGQAPEPAWPARPDLEAADGALGSPTVDGPHRRGSRPPRPAPHRQRPGELWHAPIEASSVAIPPPLVPEERIDPSELVDGDGFGPVSSAQSLIEEATGASGDDQPVEVLRGADVVDDPAPATRAADPPRARPFVDNDLPGGPSDGTATDEADAPRPRIRPPADIFDVAPSEVPITEEPPAAPAPPPTAPSAGVPAVGDVEPGVEGESVASSGPAASSGLVDAPVARRGARSAASRRSLFGAGDDDPQAPGSAVPEGRSLAIHDDGEVATEVGVIRLADGLRPDVTETSQQISLTISSGWCWIASAHASLLVQLTVPSGVLTAHPSCRCLAVVQADGSTFVSVVSGSVTLEHDIGLDRAPRELGAGTIAHVPVGGALTTDTATPDEMAADEILTRNLRLDDARASEPRDTRSA